MRLRVWSDTEEDAPWIEAPDGSDPCEVVEMFCRREFDDEWSDFITIWLRSEGGPVRTFSVNVNKVVDFYVREEH